MDKITPFRPRPAPCDCGAGLLAALSELIPDDPPKYKRGRFVRVRWDGDTEIARIVRPINRAGRLAYAVIIIDQVDPLRRRGFETWIFADQIIPLRTEDLT